MIEKLNVDRQDDRKSPASRYLSESTHLLLLLMERHSDALGF